MTGRDAPVASSLEVAPSDRMLGPSMAFLHARADRGRTTVTGSTHWQGGTPVTAADRATGEPPDGVFADWSWDGHTVEVRTDRHGFFPLYYFADADQFCVSPNLLTLLDRGAPRDLDVDALGVFLRLGYFLDDDTAFRAIRTVPAVRTLRWSAGELELEPHIVETTLNDIPYDEAVDGFVERFRASIARRLPSAPFAMPLSGGADSRHVLLELVRQGHRPRRVVTAVQHPAFADVAVAATLSRRLGIAHTVVAGLVDAGWDEELRKNRLTNFCSDEHVWFLPVADELLAATDISYDGIGGDLLSAPLALKEPVMRGIVAGRIDEQLDDAFFSHRERVVRAALTPELYAQIPEARARERVAEQLRRSIDKPNPWAAFYWSHAERREIALTPYALLAPLRVHSPYLDRDLVDYLSGLPIRTTFGGRLHVDAIRRAFPDLADVPFARDVPPPKYAQLLHRARRIPHRVAVHGRAYASGPRSALLRRVPPIVRHPATGGLLGGFNRRAMWLRQVELLASGAPQGSTSLP